MTVGHPTRCVARSTVISACLLAALSLPVVADAQPAEHAGARGQERAHQVDRPDRGDTARRDRVRPDRAKAHGHDRTRRTDTTRTSRSTASATTLSSTSSGSTSDARAGGDTDRAGPPAHANGRARGLQQDRGSARTLQSASDDARGGGAPAGRADAPTRQPRPAPASSPAGRDVVERDAQRPAPAAAAQRTRRPASIPATATTTTTTTPVATTAASPDTARDRVTTIIPLADGRRVVQLDLVGPFAELLDDVVHSIERVAPRALGPAAEPLARLVPLLLAMLGVFLALQRGIGRGLGHVPMVVTTEPMRDVDVRV